MLDIIGIHHIAIIASDYHRSKRFYVDILGFKPISEVYREDMQSYKCDMALDGTYLLELFSFPHPPRRVDRPEATGLRHLCFTTPDITRAIEDLQAKGIEVEEVRVDPLTEEKYTFFRDPDQLPLELKEKRG